VSFVVIEHGGVRRRVAVVRTAKGVWVGWPGGAAIVQPHTQQGGVVADGLVVAPMTGRVTEVRVRAAQMVAADEILIVLEAMKMQYRLAAPHAGKVVAIECREGELVDLGATLIVLE